MKKKTLLSLYLNDNRKYITDIKNLINIDDIMESPNHLTYEEAIVLSEIFGMMPDEMFYDDFINNNSIKKKISEAKKLHSYLKIK